MKTGILGGSFNPVHHGHLVLARDALEQAGLDRVCFMPCHRPPHKDREDLADDRHRLAMLQAAVKGCPAFEVSDLELQRRGISYTIDTVKSLQAAHPEDELSFIIGADSLFELYTWKSIEELLACCPFITLARPGFDLAQVTSSSLRLPDPWPARLRAGIVPGHQLEISSTEVRARCRANQAVRWLVPDAVERYIDEESVYL